MSNYQGETSNIHDGFAVHGTLMEEYPAGTDLLDRNRGLLVDFGSTFNVPASPSWNNAMEDELLLFAGDEILSVAEIKPQAPYYRVRGIRARYDTRPQTLPSATSLLFIERRRLKRLTHASFKQQARCNFKLQPTVLRKTLDLAQATISGLTLAGRVNEPRAPINLRAFQDGRNPTYAEDEDIELTWDLCESGPRDFWGRWGNAAEVKAATVLEFFTLDGTLKRTLTTASGATSHTYTYNPAPPLPGNIAADFGATPPSIKVRATALENGLKSRFYQELIIRKI